MAENLPLILDTDAGGDPDDAIALVVASTLPQLALVLTGDELNGERARFTRRLLDLLGRADVPVVRGRDLGNRRLDCIAGLVPQNVQAQPADVLAAVTAIDRPATWIGIGPMSNLADVLTTRPDLATGLRVTQMGAALNYRDPSRAEHNVRVDVEAANLVLANADRPRFVLSEITFTPELEITPGSPMHRRLGAESAPAWAKLVTAHLEQWFDRFHPGTIQHDALTLSAGLGLPFVDFADHTVAYDGIGRMRVDPNGTFASLSVRADYPAFRRWLSERVDLAFRQV